MLDSTQWAGTCEDCESLSGLSQSKWQAPVRTGRTGSNAKYWNTKMDQVEADEQIFTDYKDDKI